MNHLTRRSFVKKTVAGGLAAANMLVLTGIVQADGGGGGSTGSGVINPCENPNGGRKVNHCVVQQPNDPVSTKTDFCTHNGNTYYCAEFSQQQSSWLKGQCENYTDHCTYPPPIIP